MHTEEIQFGERRKMPVSAEVTADGWKSTGLDWADFARMGTQLLKKPAAHRRMSVPRWATNDEMLRELLAAFFDERAISGGGNSSVSRNKRLLKAAARPIPDRLGLAHKILEKRRITQSQQLDALCKEYVQSKDDERRKRVLEIEIAGLDTFLHYTSVADSGVATIAAIVVLYYRLGMDSVGVAAELNLRPPHIRQVLLRLFQTAAKLSSSNPKFAEHMSDKGVPEIGLRAVLPPGYKVVLEYRHEKVTLLEDQGKVLRIQNARGEKLFIDAKAVAVTYEKES
jgi:hypothetical protein